MLTFVYHLCIENIFNRLHLDFQKAAFQIDLIFEQHNSSFHMSLSTWSRFGKAAFLKSKIKEIEDIMNTQMMHNGRPNASNDLQQHIIQYNTFHVSLPMVHLPPNNKT